MCDLHEALDSQIPGEFSGAVLVARKGTLVLKKGYGMANYEWDVPNAPNTVFRIGSLTKPFTALAVMQLCERGLLTTEDPLKKYLPEFPKGDQVTLHHLLSHTSGIWNLTRSSDFFEINKKFHTADDLINLFQSVPFDFEPGAQFSYSNSGYVLLGKIIEMMSGQTYEEYLRENIFQPLGMTHSGYDHEETILPHRASGYKLEDGVLQNAEFIDMSFPYSAGGLYSTVEDLYIWEQALYTEKLVKKSTLEKMFQPYSDEGYGYGMYIQTKNPRITAHGGGISGFSSMILRYVDLKATVIVLSNILSDAATKLSWKLGEILSETR